MASSSSSSGGAGGGAAPAAAAASAAAAAASEGAANASVKEGESLIYCVTLFDGAELRLELDANATVLDAYSAAAEVRGVPWYTIRLVAIGQERPLPRSSERLQAATGGERNLFLVARSGSMLADCMCSELLEDCTFEHHPDRCFGKPGCNELEDFAGKRFTRCGMLRWDGVTFWCVPREPTAGAVPLWGRVMIRVVVHKCSFALGVGVGTCELDTNKDPQCQTSFCGFYHGAKSYINIGGWRGCGPWRVGQRLAVLMDVDEGAMQCYCGLEKLGPRVSGLRADVWPVIMTFGPSDSVSLSVESTQLEVADG